jgi:glyoxylase-like metal-dependent hydrolase (beta-lactamase superfamily II)
MMAQRGPDQLVEVAAGVHAYLQQGSWGFSNAGLVSSGDSALLVDTLYDLKLTERMLSEMRRRVKAAARIDTVVNTHANGDHCWGNQLLQGAEIVSSRAAADEMRELQPRLMHGLVQGSARIARLGALPRGALRVLGSVGIPYISPLAEAAEFIHACFGAFEFRDVRLTLPTKTFEDWLSLHVGDTEVNLIQVGPAHTKGDLIVHLPREKVVFTGDILFMGMHPIVWEGPVERWIAACDRILALQADVVVPGHGPITTQDGVRQTKTYWQTVLDAARRGHAAGVPPDEVARELQREGFADWTEAHRLAVNVDTVYRDLTGDRSHRDPLKMFARMARLETLGG